MISDSPRLRLLTFFGTLLVFLAFWKGSGGYTDLTEYLDDAERLWTRFDMSVPDEVVEVEDPNDPEKIELRPRYNRYAVGLAILSGPCVGLGEVLERVTSGAVTRRQITALTVPLLAAACGVLLLNLGAALGFSARVCLWTALLFALASPFLTYTRLFFTEIAITFFILLALWSIVEYAASSRQRWLLLAGLGLTGTTLCHYGNALISATLWLAFAVTILRREKPLTGLVALTIFPVLGVAGLMAMNHLRYGSPFSVGYYRYDVEEQISYVYLFAKNSYVKYLGFWLLRTPWIVFALWFGRKLFRTQPILAAGILFALVAQDIFWMCYQLLGFFPIRYQQSLLALVVVGAFFLGEALQEKFPRRGLLLVGALCVISNVIWFFYGDDTRSRPFQLDPHGSGQWIAYVWYMTPFREGTIDGYGTPAGGLQIAVCLALLSGGVLLLAKAWKASARPAQF